MTDPASGVHEASGVAGNDPLNADLTDAALDRWVADAETKAEQYRALSVGVGQVSVTETSPDGLITVTVNAGGVLTDLRISERATGMPGPRTASTVLATMRRAQARIVAQVADIMRSTIGDDPAMVDAVLADYRDKFPEPVEAPRAQSSIRPRPVVRRGQGDGWDDDNASVMEEVDR
jgi:hypothetical protein